MENTHSLNGLPRPFGFFIVSDSCAPQSSRKALMQESGHFFAAAPIIRRKI